jgi:hypothetical protein
VLVNRNGEQTAAPLPTTNYRDICLFILDEAVESFTIEQIRDRTNGANVTGTQLEANLPIVIRDVHLNLQYFRVSYNDATGLTQTPRWIKYSEANIAQFPSCVTTTPIPRAPRIGEWFLPVCQVDQFVNCLPATAPASPRIFNGVQATVIAPFGAIGPGCDNADDNCWENRELEIGPPCPLYVDENGEIDTERANNCGVDIATQSDRAPGGTGPKQVFIYTGGLIQFFGGASGTLRIVVLSPSGVITTRYNYTHIEDDTVPSTLLQLLQTPNEYLASGIEIGSYGPVGAYGATEFDEHVDTVQVDNESSYSAPPWE